MGAAGRKASGLKVTVSAKWREAAAIRRLPQLHAFAGGQVLERRLIIEDIRRDIGLALDLHHVKTLRGDAQELDRLGPLCSSLTISIIRIGINRRVDSSSIRLARPSSLSIFCGPEPARRGRAWLFNQSRPPCRPNCSSAAPAMAAALPRQARQR